MIIWDPRTGSMIHKLEGHKQYVTSCAFSNDNQLLASGSNDRTIIIWNLSKIKDKEINIEMEPSKEPVKISRKQSQRYLKKSISEWSVEHVLEWLLSIDMEPYTEIFRENKIDGNELTHLTNDSLLVNLHIGIDVFKKH